MPKSVYCLEYTKIYNPEHFTGFFCYLLVTPEVSFREALTKTQRNQY